MKPTERVRVYLDYNATAPVRPEVRQRIEPLLFGDPKTGDFGNPSSVHWAGQAARRHLEEARLGLAGAFARKPSEVIFTSGGTEADNLALFGVLLAPTVRKPRLVISAVEHPAILAAADRLQQLGCDIVRIGVDENGRLDLNALKLALEVPTTLVSVMAINNETGVQSPLNEVRALTQAAQTWLHIDAVQAPGRIPLPTDADLITISGHKMGGLKGAGALIVRESVPFAAQTVGGPQERGHRAGTENVAAVVALAESLRLAEQERETATTRWTRQRARIDAAIETIPHANIMGDHRVSNTTTAIFRGTDGEAVLQALDLAGFAASSGSACSSGSLEPSHVLLAMGVSPEEALSAVRFSLGWATTDADIDALVSVLPEIVKQVRA